MFNKKPEPKTPLLVEVTGTEWYSYGDPTSFHQMWLHSFLTQMGGINESVSPGSYHFNVTRRLFKFYVTLVPVE